MRVSFAAAIFTVLVSTLLPAGRAQAATALVRHAPALNGTIEGSVQQMLAESVTLNGGAIVTGDLFVPGLPTLRLDGNPTFSGTVAGSGASSPSGYTVTLNGNARLGYLRTRTDPSALPTVAAPPAPPGTRSVSLNNSSQSPGDFATLRHLTLNGNVGSIAVPPGIYGDFTANGGGGFTLGVAGATTPAVYAFQRLTLNGNSTFDVVGPVVVTLANGVSANGSLGATTHPEWLTLRLAGGGLTLNGNVSVYAYVKAPAGAVVINANSRLIGGLTADRLTLNGNSMLRLVAQVVNQPPTVALTAPADGATFTAPAALTLAAAAADADGTIGKVEFYQGSTKLGEVASPSAPPSTFTFPLTLTSAGSYTFKARAIDNDNAATDSAPVTVSVGANQPPTVALTLPLSGTLFNAPAIIPLLATANDSDGAIAKVEFFQGPGKLGESVATPFTFTWTGMLPGSYALSAKATDNLGASATTGATLVTVQATLPQSIDFEAAEGYQLGPLHGQGGWTVVGTAEVIDTAAQRGTRAAILAPTTPATGISYPFPAAVGQPIVFIDIFAKTIVGDASTPGSLLEAEGARVTVLTDAAQGEVAVFNGDGDGGGAWQRTGFKTALTAIGQTADWLRLSVREDFATKKWDLSVNGRMVAADLGFVDFAAPAFSRFALTGVTTAPTLIDDLFAGFDNPLFADADKDGLDDAWETANGLNPAANDRNADRDADGLTNLREYLLGTRANLADTDGDGMPDGWEVAYGLTPVAGDATADFDGDGVNNLREFLLGRSPTRIAVPDTTGAVNLRLYTPSR